MTRARWLVAWLACTVVSFGLFARPKTTPIHPDEVYWIGSSYYYHLAFERLDWTHPDWKLQPARENPPVAKYVIGVGLALQGQHIVNRDMLGCFHLMFVAPGAWGEGEDYAKRAAVVGDQTTETCRRVQGGPGVTNPRALPYLARYVMLACAALISLLIFGFGTSVATPATGLIASQLLLLHPHMIHAYNRTMADPVALLFGTAAALAGWKWFSAFGLGFSAVGSRLSATAPLAAERRAPTAESYVTGVLLALAVGAKMNAMIVVLLFGAVVAVAAMLAWRRGDQTRARLVLASGAAVLALAFAVFVAINPAILADFSSGLADLVREPQRNTAIQARVMFQLHLGTLAQKFGAMSQVAGGALPFLIAAAVCIWACARTRTVGMWFVAAWWAIAVVCVTAWIPFDWTRYMLPILPPFTLLAAHAMVFGARLLSRRRLGVKT